MAPSQGQLSSPTTTSTTVTSDHHVTTAAADSSDNGGNRSSHSSDAQEEDMSVEELLYSTASFHAIVKPVALTMILTALCVTYIYTPETFAATQEQLSNSYVAFEAPDDASTAEKVGLSLTNALIIVSAICVATFVIVLLYKYRCLKCLIGYMVLASAALLGFLGGNMFAVAIETYNLAVDQFSYYFTLWNFAIVGTAAIFSPWGGFPTCVTQGYLIATSVILAWQLAALDPWTSWALLVVLALYDLCAVLTPCGPLKALVHLMSQDDSPDMPGLLYEAELPQDAQRPGRRERERRRSSMAEMTTTTQQSQSSSSSPRQSTTTSASATATESTTTTSNGTTATNGDTVGSAPPSEAATTTTEALTTQQQEMHDESLPQIEADSCDSKLSLPAEATTAAAAAAASQAPLYETSEAATEIEMTRIATDEETPRSSSPIVASQPVTVAARLAQTTAAAADAPMEMCQSQQTDSSVDALPPQRHQRRPRAILPLAIAKLYKLPIESEEPERRSDWTPLLEEGGVQQQQQDLNPNELLARQYTPQQLRTPVIAIFPRNGGRIETVGSRYIVKDRHGRVKRTLLLDEQGRVLEERQRTPEEEREEERQNNTIKLGLGDFIFYSVLVSKAVLYSFTTFVACFLVILAGLGVTLVLLAVYHKALPALPISIMLGVIFYLATRGLIEPWYEAVLGTPYYV